MNTVTGKSVEVLNQEIEDLYSSFVESKRSELFTEHSDKADAFSKIIMIYLGKILAYQNDIKNNLHKFYGDFMSIKVIQLVYLTWKTGDEKNSEVEYSYEDLKDISVLPGVFSPRFASDSYLWAKYMVDSGIVKDKVVLEMGAGTGVISLYLSLYGNIKSIVAADINDQAIKNINLNIKKHNIDTAKFEVKKSNLFSSFDNSYTFDIIFWAYVWLKLEDEEIVKIIDIEADQNIKRLLNSITDNQYQMLKKFLLESKQHLTKGGKLLLITSDFLPNNEVKEMAEDLGYNFKIEKFTQNSEVVKGANMVLDLYQITLSLS